VRECSTDLFHIRGNTALAFDLNTQRTAQNNVGAQQIGKGCLVPSVPHARVRVINKHTIPLRRARGHLCLRSGLCRLAHSSERHPCSGYTAGHPNALQLTLHRTEPITGVVVTAAKSRITSIATSSRNVRTCPKTFNTCWRPSDE